MGVEMGKWWEYDPGAQRPPSQSHDDGYQLGKLALGLLASVVSVVFLVLVLLRVIA